MEDREISGTIHMKFTHFPFFFFLFSTDFEAENSKETQNTGSIFHSHNLKTPQLCMKSSKEEILRNINDNGRS